MKSLFILLFALCPLLTFSQLPTRLKLKQLEQSTDPSPSTTYFNGYGQVPISDNSGNLTYALPGSNLMADFHQGSQIGVSNAFKLRGLGLPSIGNMVQYPRNVGWGSAAGVVQTSTQFGGFSILYFAANAATGTNAPRLNFYKVKTNNATSVIPGSVGDVLMLIQGQNHRGLVDTIGNTEGGTFNVYNNSNGYVVLRTTLDSALVTGELATKTELWARRVNEGNNPIPSGISMLELSGARSEIRLPTYLSTRNDAGGPVNILSTNNVGTLRSHPVADIYPTASGTLDFPSTAAGDISELTINVTNAIVGRPVIVGEPATIPDKGTFSARVTAAGVVTVRFANNDLTVAKDPVSGIFTVTVIQ